MKYDLKGHFKLWRSFILFSFIPSNLITTLTYVPMDNFCPCLIDDYLEESGGFCPNLAYRGSVIIPFCTLVHFLILAVPLNSVIKYLAFTK